MKDKIIELLKCTSWNTEFAVYGLNENNKLQGHKIDDVFDIDEVLTKSEYDAYLINTTTYSLSIQQVIDSGKLLGYALVLNGSKFFKGNHYGLMDTIEEAVSALEDCKKKIFEKNETN